jgi:hypothetical protein
MVHIRYLALLMLVSVRCQEDADTKQLIDEIDKNLDSIVDTDNLDTLEEEIEELQKEEEEIEKEEEKIKEREH